MTEPAVGASTWASGSQECSGHIGTLMAKAAAKARNSQIWMPAGMPPLAIRSGTREGALVDAQPQDGQQHQDGTSHRVQEELDGGIDAARSAPDADQEVHRHQGEFPEDVETGTGPGRGRRPVMPTSSSRKKIMKSLTRSSTAVQVERMEIGVRKVVSRTSRMLRPSTPMAKLMFQPATWIQGRLKPAAGRGWRLVEQGQHPDRQDEGHQRGERAPSSAGHSSFRPG